MDYPLVQHAHIEPGTAPISSAASLVLQHLLILLHQESGAGFGKLHCLWCSLLPAAPQYMLQHYETGPALQAITLFCGAEYISNADVLRPAAAAAEACEPRGLCLFFFLVDTFGEPCKGVLVNMAPAEPPAGLEPAFSLSFKLAAQAGEPFSVMNFLDSLIALHKQTPAVVQQIEAQQCLSGFRVLYVTPWC